MAINFRDGVILGADSRTTTGAYIANRVTDKLTQVLAEALVHVRDLEATIGAPVRAVEATDASLAFASLSSVIVGVAIGARVSP